MYFYGMFKEPQYGRTRNSLRNSATALILQVVAMLICITVNRNYTFLKEKVQVTKALREKYLDITQKTKYIVFYKLGGYTVAKSSPIFIYAFTSFAVVGCYGNYLMLTTNLTAILTARLAKTTK